MLNPYSTLRKSYAQCGLQILFLLDQHCGTQLAKDSWHWVDVTAARTDSHWTSDVLLLSHEDVLPIPMLGVMARIKSLEMDIYLLSQQD